MVLSILFVVTVICLLIMLLHGGHRLYVCHFMIGRVAAKLTIEQASSAGGSAFKMSMQTMKYSLADSARHLSGWISNAKIMQIDGGEVESGDEFSREDVDTVVTPISPNTDVHSIRVGVSTFEWAGGMGKMVSSSGSTFSFVSVRLVTSRVSSWALLGTSFCGLGGLGYRFHALRSQKTKKGDEGGRTREK